MVKIMKLGLFISLALMGLLLLIHLLSCDNENSPSIPDPTPCTFDYCGAYSSETPYECPVPDWESTNTYYETDVVYDSLSTEDLLGRMYIPANSAIKNAMVVVHGGAWSEGTRTMKAGFCRHFAEKNFVVMSIDYRLAPDTQYPEMVQDVVNSIKFMRNNAAEYDIDTNCIGIVGASAGGNLAALAAYLGDEEIMQRECEECGDATADVRYIVSYYGVMDMENDPLVSAFAPIFPGSQDLLDEASPINYVETHNIPMFFSHGLRDMVVNYNFNALAMSEKLVENNTTMSLNPLDTNVHGYMAGSSLSDLCSQSLPDLHIFLEYVLTH